MVGMYVIKNSQSEEKLNTYARSFNKLNLSSKIIDICIFCLNKLMKYLFNTYLVYINESTTLTQKMSL